MFNSCVGLDFRVEAFDPDGHWDDHSGYFGISICIFLARTIPCPVGQILVSVRHNETTPDFISKKGMNLEQIYSQIH